jgi:hypothetical protein
MKTFQVPVVKTIYGFVEVNAKNKTEAIKIVNELIENQDIDDQVDVSSEDYEIQEDEVE